MPIRSRSRRLRETAFLTLSVCVIAQPVARPEFEVASVKPGMSALKALPGGRIRLTAGGTLNVANLTLKELIAHAWAVREFQVSGGPAWADSARYDIGAKPDHSAKWDEVMLMLQTLLVDRFQLATHRETKELPIYALVIARKDGKLGPGLTESKEGGCTKADPSKPFPLPEPGRPDARVCDTMRMSPRGFVRAVSVPLDSLAHTLADLLGRTVIDDTGLAGRFDISLEWTPDNIQAMQLPPEVPKPPPSDAPPVSIFAAIQERLGIKLESRKGPVEVIVIDRAERPSEN
jgi:uncharacterized protein (TIGR03435 family)